MNDISQSELENGHLQTKEKDQITFEYFNSELKNLAVGELFEIDRLPDKQEVVAIANNPFEIIFIKTTDNLIYAAKGTQNDSLFEESRKQLGDKQILSIGHTHPKNNEENKEKEMWKTSLPSAGDLTSIATGAKTNFIFNTFGRITFWPIENIELHEENFFGSKSVSQDIINNVMSLGAKKARKKGIKDVYTALNFLGEYLGNNLNAKFKFERWEEVNDPFSD